MAETTIHCGNPGCGKAVRICPAGGNCDYTAKYVHVFTELHACDESGEFFAEPESNAATEPDGFMVVLLADGAGGRVTVGGGSGLLSLKEATMRAAKGNDRAALSGRKAQYVVAEVRIIGNGGGA
jgi:hypothetical protein